MHFMVTYTMKPEARAEAVAKFKAGGGPPPEGVKKLGRWHDAGGLTGFTLAEADSVVPIAKWCNEWSEHLQQDIHLVMSDEEMVEVISG